MQTNAKPVMNLLFISFAVLVTGCTSDKSQHFQAKDMQSPSVQTPAIENKPTKSLVLEVKQGPLQFSMYPEYVSESKSILKLTIQNQSGEFLKGATASASLNATDGHKQTAHFAEDDRLSRYVAEVSLNHHEDYEVKTEIVLKDGQTDSHYTPRFFFHCADPILPTNDGHTVGSAKQ